MSKNEYDFSDLEAILAEFSDKGPKLDETEYTEASYEPVPEAEPADARDDEALDGIPEDIPEDVPAPEAEVEAEAETAAPVPEPARQKPWRAGTLPPLYARDEQAAIDAPLSRREKRAQARLRAEKARLDKRAEKVRRAREDRRFESAPAAPAPYTEPVHRAIPLALRLLLALIFLALSLAALCWTLFNVHPASGTLSFSGGDSRLRLAETLDARMNNAAADALGDQAYIRKIYTLPAFRARATKSSSSSSSWRTSASSASRTSENRRCSASRRPRIRRSRTTTLQRFSRTSASSGCTITRS